MIGEGTIVITATTMVVKVIGALTERKTSMRNEALARGHLTLIRVHHVGEMLGRFRGDILVNGRRVPP